MGFDESAYIRLLSSPDRPGRVGRRRAVRHRDLDLEEPMPHRIRRPRPRTVQRLRISNITPPVARTSLPILADLQSSKHNHASERCSCHDVRDRIAGRYRSRAHSAVLSFFRVNVWRGVSTMETKPSPRCVSAEATGMPEGRTQCGTATLPLGHPVTLMIRIRRKTVTAAPLRRRNRPP